MEQLRTEGWKAKLETITNIAILIICVISVVLVANKYFLHRSPPSILSPQVGSTISVPGIDFSRSNHTLVIAISTQCHFCEESTDFYKKLVLAAERHGTQVVGVFPQESSVSKKYLESHLLWGVQNVQERLSAIQVEGTPTLILVDRKGKIAKSWVGKLPEKEENEVIASLL